MSCSFHWCFRLQSIQECLNLCHYATNLSGQDRKRKDANELKSLGNHKFKSRESLKTHELRATNSQTKNS